MFEIKKGVPKPAKAARGRGTSNKYPFAQMEIGDFFEVPESHYMDFPDLDQTDRIKKHRERVNAAARGFALRFNNENGITDSERKMRFTVAGLENGNVGVWRDS